MTALRRIVRRTVERDYRRPLVVALFPATPGHVAEIEVRESRRRTGYRVSLSALHSILAMRAAGISPARRRKGTR